LPSICGIDRLSFELARQSVAEADPSARLTILVHQVVHELAPDDA
jgi:hypothetical protein